jgi:hypothetical protein
MMFEFHPAVRQDFIQARDFELPCGMVNGGTKTTAND